MDTQAFFIKFLHYCDLLSDLWKKGHSSLDCYQRSNYVFQGFAPPPTLAAMTAQTSFSPDTVWITDSGASHHMVSDMHMLETAAPCVNEGNDTVGNGAGLKIDHVGTTSIPCATTTLKLPIIFHVPHLTANLLSVHQLCKDNDCLIAFDQFGFSIQDRISKQVLLTGKSDRGMYYLPSSLALQHRNIEAKAYLGQLVKSSLWHARLGHPTNTVVKQMLNKSHISICDDS